MPENEFDWLITNLLLLGRFYHPTSKVPTLRANNKSKCPTVCISTFQHLLEKLAETFVRGELWLGSVCVAVGCIMTVVCLKIWQGIKVGTGRREHRGGDREGPGNDTNKKLPQERDERF